MKQVQNGRLSVAQAREQIMDDGVQSFANLDYRRAERTGFPEVVFAQGKTPKQVAQILDSLAAHQKNVSTVASCVLATRVDEDVYRQIREIPLHHGNLQYYSTARIISMTPNSQSTNDAVRKKKRVVVACAGTTDLPVAEEAAVTLECAQVPVDRIYDVGVAGLHRVINAIPRLRNEDVGCIIVCAGMDGALPSVVGGLVAVPVIACPTSVGYGAAFGGVSALLTMLYSYAPGVAVVNIDNGFGAAAFAYKCMLER